jgi:hypothetical protein
LTARDNSSNKEHLSHGNDLVHNGKLLIGVMLVLWAAGTISGGAPANAPAATGRLRLTFSEHSPLSGMDTVLQRLDMADHPPDNLQNMAYDLTFDVFVPPNYTPNVPHGLLVWMGVSGFSAAWLDVLPRHKLILVCANNVKGRTARHGAALDAVHNLKKLYNIDDPRVYASGFSAGGQIATHMVRCFPEVFRGGLFLLGGSFYLSRPGENGQREPTVEAAYPNWKGQLDQLKKSVKLVMVKGGSDPEWPPQEGRSDYHALWLDGFTHVSYFEVPGLGHTHPDARWFEQGIVALDQSKPLTPPLISPTKEPHPLPGQVAQAQRILATAQYYLEQTAPGKSGKMPDRMRRPLQDKSRKYLQQVLEEYPTTPAAIRARALLGALDPSNAERPAPAPGRTNPPPTR